MREGGMAAWIISSIAYFFAIVILLIFSIMNVTIIRVIRSIIVIIALNALIAGTLRAKSVLYHTTKMCDR